MRTRRTADDFVRDMKAKLHTVPGDIGARPGTRTERSDRRTGEGTEIKAPCQEAKQTKK